jgi:hypothetical protein
VRSRTVDGAKISRILDGARDSHRRLLSAPRYRAARGIAPAEQVRVYFLKAPFDAAVLDGAYLFRHLDARFELMRGGAAW